MNEQRLESRVNICLQGYKTSINVSLDGNDTKKKAGSALQRPYVRRAELAAMLRKALKKRRSKKAQKTYWTALLATYISKNANNNSFEQTPPNDN